jgi:hypothetical protein
VARLDQRQRVLSDCLGGRGGFFTTGHPHPAGAERPLPNDDVVLDLVAFIEKRASAKPTGRHATDVQPWPIESVRGNGPDRFTVHLIGPGDTRPRQVIQVRRGANGWIIDEMF